MAKVTKIRGLNPDRIYVMGKLVEFDENGVAEVEDQEILEQLKKVEGYFKIEGQEEAKEEKQEEAVEEGKEEEAPKKRTRKKAE